MSLPWRVATVFGVCLAVGVAAVAWLSREIWRLDARDAEARGAVEREETVRLALWRMDAALAPIFAREGARPYHAYQPLYPPLRSYNRNYAPLAYQSVWIVSPLLVDRQRFVVQHFQVDDRGEITSPQAPVGNARDVAEGQQFVTSRQIVDATERLRSLAGAIRYEDLVPQLPVPQEEETGLDLAPAMQVLAPEAESVKQLAEAPLDKNPKWAATDYALRTEANRFARQSANASRGMLQQRAVPPPAPTPTAAGAAEAKDSAPQTAQTVAPPKSAPLPAAPPPQIAAIDSDDLARKLGRTPLQPEVPNQRQQIEQQQLDNNVFFQEAFGLPARPPERVVEGTFQPLWLGERLFVCRRVAVGDAELVQGFELDWPKLQAWLAESVAEILPGAKLEPAPHPDDADRWHMLAALPVRLNPAPRETVLITGWTPARISVVVAWIGSAVAVAAVAFLLRGAVALSERRGAFVSSVTHELRTPLTTFRMYAEMLAAGMVKDPAVEKKYLGTLQSEADRLSHLVENVLSYARLERGRQAGRIEPLAVGPLLSRLDDRLRQRTAAAGMTWTRDRTDPLLERTVEADAIAVEQILFNLVDNACKYAATADEKRVELALAADPRGHLLRFAVRDHGPGILPRDAHRVFQGFHKSAFDAAVSAPGVGLGLALSRRLARRMGGDLRLVPCPDGCGACFVLSLPIVKPAA